MKRMLIPVMALTIMLSACAVRAEDYNSKEMVQKVQTALNDSGYNCGEPDGVAGNATKSAIASYRADHGLTEGDSIDEELCAALQLTGNSDAATTERTETTESADGLEAWIDVTGQKVEGGKVTFDITTNLPDEVDLMLSLRHGDFNTGDTFTAQQHVTVSGGAATSTPFSNKGEPLTGDYDLDVSMSIPKIQSDAVRAVIGENGENLTGDIVTDEKSISALFLVSIGDDDVFVTPEIDYTQTVFRTETEEEEEEPVIESNPSRAAENKAFISEHDNEIVVGAKMSLDNFIANYKISLAPQLWTIAMFDDKGAVIASTSVTYQDVVYTYYYVGTPNFEGDEIVSFTPHYLALDSSITGTYVLGDDHYCDEVFAKLPQ